MNSPTRVTRLSRSLVIPTLVEIWEEILNASPLNAASDFFELGGDSLAASSIVVAVHERLDVVIDPVEIFDAPVLEDFAAVIARVEVSADVRIEGEL